MRLIYTPKAREDLRNIKSYISKTLLNKTAADNIAKKIIKDCALLKDNPMLGISLSDKIDRQTDVRFLIIKNYIAFYKIDDDRIMVLRIQDARTNYINILFKD